MNNYDKNLLDILKRIHDELNRKLASGEEICNREKVIIQNQKVKETITRLEIPRGVKTWQE